MTDKKKRVETVMTPKQYAVIKAASEGEGFDHVSTFMRTVVLGYIKEKAND